MESSRRLLFFLRKNKIVYSLYIAHMLLRIMMVKMSLFITYKITFEDGISVDRHNEA